MSGLDDREMLAVYRQKQQSKTIAALEELTGNILTTKLHNVVDMCRAVHTVASYAEALDIISRDESNRYLSRAKRYKLKRGFKA